MKKQPTVKSFQCLYCYQPIEKSTGDFHAACSKKFFGTEIPPVLGYSLADMKKLASNIIRRRIAVTGAQPKISLNLEKPSGDPKHTRFTMVGLWGNFILKPPSESFALLPENEDLTMHLAALTNIPVAEHTLLRLGSGELAFITKRFDRVAGRKLALEDMCQLTETLTENKYRGSYEGIGKVINRISDSAGFDSRTFFETLIFSFLTGNADMHLKNFSLLTGPDNKTGLSPAYDLLSTKIAMPEDTEEMALTLNGRKNKIKRSDFDVLAKTLKIDDRSRQNIYAKFDFAIEQMNDMIDKSFLPAKLKDEYKSILSANARKLSL